MIDIEKAKKVLKEYIERYDDSNGRIKIKKIHIFNVAKNAKKIAQNLQLSEEDIKLAELIGLLHDIGRFEQVKRYHTFADRESVNHAALGIEILFNDGMIREFVEDAKYDEIIKTAIQNHNTKEIQEEIKGITLTHCKIIRDADKLDIYKILSEQKIEDAVWFPTDNLENEEISKNVYQDFINHKKIDYKYVKTNIDCMVSWVDYIYDIYYPETLEIIKKEQYVNKIIERIEYKNKKTKEQMKEIRKIANEYINQKII